MKRFLAFLLLTASALAVQLAWDDDANPPDRIRGYRFYDVTAGATNMLAEVKDKAFDAKLSAGEHVVYVTAVSTDGIESEPSNAVTVWVPAAVKNVAVVITGN